MLKKEKRPFGISALAIFFVAGAIICLIASLTLAFPNSPIEPMWRLNPRARTAFAEMGWWPIPLMITVGTSCALAAIGFWRGKRWGHIIGFTLIAINLVGDIVNVLLGTERRAIVGVPIASGLLLYLASKGVRHFFYSAPIKPS